MIEQLAVHGDGAVGNAKAGQTPGGEGILASFLPDEIRLCEKNGKKRRIAARIAVDLRENPYGDNDGILPLAAMSA